MKPLNKAWAVYESLNGTTQLDMFFDTVEEARECMNELNDGGLIGTPCTVHPTVTRTIEDERDRDRRLAEKFFDIGYSILKSQGPPMSVDLSKPLAAFWEEENGKK